MKFIIVLLGLSVAIAATPVQQNKRPPVQDINVRWDSMETQFIVAVHLGDTVRSIKEKIHQNWPSISVDNAMLFYDNKLLGNDELVESYGLKEDSNISLSVSEYVDPLVGPKASKKLFIRWTQRGVYFPIDVELTDTVWTLKDRIHELFASAAPVEDQYLLHANDLLHNRLGLDAYKLKDSDSISLEVLHDESRPVEHRPLARIIVEWPKTGIQFELFANLTDTVKSIKAKIHDKWPLIGVEQQSMEYDHKSIDDDRTLKSYGIRDNRRIALGVSDYKDPLIGPKSSKTLFVEWTERGIYFPIDVELTDTVWTLKDRIHEMFASAAPVEDQYLLHVNDLLHSKQTLHGYKLKDGDTISLEVIHDESRPAEDRPLQTISVRWDQADMDLLFFVNLTDTVRSLKEKIHQKWPSISMDDQLLDYNSNHLIDDRTLKSYGLRDGRGVSMRVLHYTSHRIGQKASKKLTINWSEKMIHFGVNMELTDTVWSLKGKIHELVPSIPVGDQILIHANRLLTSNLRSLGSYGLRDGDSLLLELNHDQKSPVIAIHI